MNIRLLRGQVVVRENLTADTDHYRHIIVPNVSDAERHDPDARQRARKWHRGTVLAMGSPMLSKGGVEVQPEFKVGDEVIFHWAHREKSWTREWVDGELACWVPQALVDAVLNESLTYAGASPIAGPLPLPELPDGRVCLHCRHDVMGHLVRTGLGRVVCPTEVTR